MCLWGTDQVIVVVQGSQQHQELQLNQRKTETRKEKVYIIVTHLYTRS